MQRRFVCSVLLMPLLTVSLACRDRADQRFSTLPATVHADDVVAELATSVGRVVRHAEDGVPRIDGVQPARSRGRRLALVALPPSTVEYDVRIPEGSVLRVGTTVAIDERAERPPTDEARVRFFVRVAGELVWERVWDGGRKKGRRERHWVDAEIDLARFANRDVVMAFETETPEGSLTIGTPAWSRVQLVHRSVVARQTPTPQAPNVLLLVVDTLRADRLGSYGATPTRTPNLDRLAAGGTVFRNAWAQAPWTLPSIATIFTGRYPRAHGVVGRSADFGRPAGLASHEGNWAYLPDTIPTIASLVRRSGVTTFGVTSNLLISRENNLARGFETFVELPVSPMPIQWARAAVVRETFAEWLALNREHRFFAYLHYMEPHDPYVPAAGLRSQCPASTAEEVCDGVVRNLARDRERGGPVIDAAVVRYLESLYDGEVAAWDADLPQLLESLERNGLRDRTVVIVTSDHGEEFSEHGHLGHRKQLYAESLAVPVIVAGPGVPPAVRSDLVELVDLLPTVLGVVAGPNQGIDPDDQTPGRDLLHGATGRIRTHAETRYGVVEDRKEAVELLGVRDGRWGYLRAPAAGYERLHDLGADPGETRDVSASHREVCDDLRGDLAAWVDGTKAPTAHSSEAEQITDKLRALGYVE